MSFYGNYDRPTKRFSRADLLVGLIFGALCATPALVEIALSPGSNDLLSFVASMSMPLLVMAVVAPVYALWRGRVRRREFDNGRRTMLRTGHCPACLYDLRGTLVPRCPECGDQFTPEEWASIPSRQDPTPIPPS